MHARARSKGSNGLKIAEAPEAGRASVAGKPGLLERARGGWRSWSQRADVRAALLTTLGLRALCSAVAALALAIRPGPEHFASAIARYVTQPWLRWDTGWYLDIARHGYATYGSTAFLPLYPLLVRVVGMLLGGHLLLAALLLSTVSAFGVFLCLFRLVARLSALPNAPRWALAAAALLPVSFFLMAGYTEALFLWLALAGMLAALEGRWGRFAMLSALASLTRHQGLLLALLVGPAIMGLLLGWRAAGWHSSAWRAARGQLLRVVLSALAGPLAYLAWVGYVSVVLGAPLPWAPLAAAGGWNLHATWPGAGVLADLAALARGAIPAPLQVAAPLDAAAALVAAATLFFARRRLPLGLTLYLIACWCLALSKVQADGLTVSAARYLLLLLPLAFLPGEWLARAPALLRVGWVVGGGLALVALAWVFVLGGWVG